MIGAMERHRVQVLRAAGMTQQRIAAEAGISERSVRTICAESTIEELIDVVRARERGVGPTAPSRTVTRPCSPARPR